MRHATASRGQGRLIALAAVLGGLLVAGGALLPWLSFYAGLYPMRGVAGLWGRLLGAGGALGAVVGSVALWRAGPFLERAMLVLGAILTVSSGWLVVQLLLTVGSLRANPMLVPRIGPGLFVALAGALLMLLAAVVDRVLSRPDGGAAGVTASRPFPAR